MKTTLEKTDNKIISYEVKDSLPKELIDYLWILSIPNEINQFFLIKSGELSGQTIEDIYRIDKSKCLFDRHRIFGISPINRTISIIKDNDIYSMTLLDTILMR